MTMVDSQLSEIPDISETRLESLESVSRLPLISFLPIKVADIRLASQDDVKSARI